MILVIDNFDSFTYNIVQYLEELGRPCVVFRNDALDCETIKEMNPDGIILSPGSGNPHQAGITMEVIQTFANQIPILGVCLGHQSIAQVFGGQVVRAKRMMHGKVSRIHHNEVAIFAGVPNPFAATRYHSLVVSDEALPPCLEVTARAPDGTIMAIRHEKYQVHGVQFHPESIMTPHGKHILNNFLELIA